MSKTATKVFVIPGTPSLGFDGPGCVSRHLSSEYLIDRVDCQAKGRSQLIDSVATYLGQTVSHFSNIYILDLNDLVCPGGDCNAISEDGVVVFRDSQHLTDTFVRKQAPIIRKRLRRIYKD